MNSNPISVRPIATSEHQAFIAAQKRSAEVSFLQLPQWAQVKSAWSSESLGFFAGQELQGVALVLYRQVPHLKSYLAYLPEGPVLNWEGIASDAERAQQVAAQLQALVTYLKSKHAFAVRIGPTLIHQLWHAKTVKAAIADPDVALLAQVPADYVNPDAEALAQILRSQGWLAPASDEAHFSAGQPMYHYQLALTGKSEEDVLKGMNQLWRRNIRKAAKVGVQVRRGGRDDLKIFYQLYVETAARDGFTGRPESYFTTMWDALNAQSDVMRLYIAEYEGTPIAAATLVHVNAHAWYSYGASSTAHRDVRGSNAMQWQMIKDSLALEAATYDLRGITQGLAADDPEIGLIQFKAGTGGDATSYIGEWDFPIHKLLYKLFQARMRRR